MEFNVWISCGFIMLWIYNAVFPIPVWVPNELHWWPPLTGSWILSSILCFLTSKWFFFYSEAPSLILKLLALENLRWRSLSQLFLKSSLCEINHFCSPGCWHFVWTPRGWKGSCSLTAAVLTLQGACTYLNICCPLLKASQGCQIQALVIKTCGSPYPCKIFSKGCVFLIFQ